MFSLVMVARAHAAHLHLKSFVLLNILYFFFAAFNIAAVFACKFSKLFIFYLQNRMNATLYKEDDTQIENSNSET